MIGSRHLKMSLDALFVPLASPRVEIPSGVFRKKTTVLIGR
jgi:hypothetical protein